MATQKERAVVDLVINGRAAETNLKDIDRAVSSVRNSLRQMNEADDPAKIAQRRREYQQLVNTQKERRDRLYGIDRAQKQVEKSGRSMLAEITGGNILADLFQRGVDAAVEFGRKIIQTASTFQRFEAVLTNALGDRGKARESLRFLQTFAENTPFEVDQLTDSFVRLVNRGFKPTEAELTSLGDLASSQGKSMEQVVEALLDAETFEFERLKELGIRAKKDGDTVQLAFKGITKEVAASDVAIREALIDFGKMDGVAGSMEAISKTMGGQISNLSDGWTALALAIGQRAGGAISEVIGGAKTLVGWMTELVSVPLSEKMEEERIAMNALHIQLMATNEGTDASRKIIGKLIEQYPDYLGHLDADKASHDDITKAIRVGNKAMIDRIVLQEKLEEVEKKQRFSATATIEQETAAKNAATAIARLSKEYDILVKEGLDPVAQARDVLSQLQDQTSWWQQGPFQDMDIKDLERATDQMESFGTLATAGADAAAALRQEAEKMADDMGISLDEPTGTPTPNPRKTPNTSTPSKKEIKEAEKLATELKKIREKQMVEMMSGQDQEIERTRIYYQNLREKASGNAEAMIKIAELEANAIALINKKYTDVDPEELKKAELLLSQANQSELLLLEEKYAGQLLSEQVYNEQKLLLEGEHLLQMKLLREQYGADTAEIDAEIRENHVKQVEATTENEKRLLTELAEAEKNLIDAKRDAMSAGIDIMMNFVREGSAAWSALFAVQKALAIADVITKTQAEIAGYFTTYSLIPGGPAIAGALAAAAKIRMATSIATIVAQSVAQVKGFAEGGFTNGNPGGYVDVPTFFRMGKREYIAGEAGGEWISPNWMLKNPVTANIIGMLEALRQSPSLANVSRPENDGSPSTPQAGGAIPPDLFLLIEEIRGLRSDVVRASSRPIDFNVNKFRYADSFMTRIMADRDV